MKPIRKSTANVILKGAGCEDLPTTYEDGVYKSRWTLSEGEILALIDGGEIELSIWGMNHPPVYLSVEDGEGEE